MLDTDSERLRMLEQLVKALDYDVFNSLFIRPEDPVMAQEQIADLMEIIRNFTS